MREFLLPLLLAGCLVPAGWMPAGAQGCPAPSFGTPVPFATADWPIAVISGDFNGDGKADLAVANDGTNNVSVLLNTGSGAFGAAVNYNTGSAPASLVGGDFNRDGKLDLAVANFTSNNVSVLLNTGSGAFGAATFLGAGLGPTAVASGDFNRDGKPDLAVANQNSDNVSILLGDGSGNFGSAIVYPAGDGLSAITTGDFNRDGKPDLAVANGDPNLVSVLLGDGSGGFGSPTSYTVSDRPTAVSAGDVNGDGIPDLVVSNRNSFNLSVLLGIGDGTFGAAASYNVGTYSLTSAIADFNSDGRVDVAVSSALVNKVYVLPGTGTGSFGTATTFTLEDVPSAVTTGDFNDDGRTDLAATIGNLDKVSVLTNTCALYSCTVPSFNTAPLLETGEGPRSVTSGDFNRDGLPDLAVTNSENDNISVFLALVSGGFGTAAPYTAGNTPEQVITADFNRDGKPDLATVNSNSDDISVLIGNGDGTFATATSYATGDVPLSLASGDFNRDGVPDLVAAIRGPDNLSVRLGNGDGTFGAATTFAAGDGPSFVATGDFNRDGIPDLAVTNEYSDNVSLLPGNGNGTFGAAINATVGDVPLSLASGDFNSDGNPDLAVANTGSDNVTVLPGNGDGTFGAATTLTAGNATISIVAGDVNGDGIYDLAVANLEASSLYIFPGKGDGTFDVAATLTGISYPVGVCMADLNRDGKYDLAVTNSVSDKVSVLLNTCLAAVAPEITCPANKTANTGATTCTASVGFEAMATGVPAPVITYAIGTTAITSPHSFPKGETTVTAKATNIAGEVSCTFTVTVADAQAPSITCPANKTVNTDPGKCSAVVSITNAVATDNCTGVSVEGTRSDSKPLSDPYPVGVTTITWKATDAANNTATCTQTVTVNDNLAPTFIGTPGASPTATLAPPNHKMREITLNYLATDNCSGSGDIIYSIVSVTSNEPDDGEGDGDRPGDIVIVNDQKVQLRAERSGAGTGRIYTVTVKAADAAGNFTTATIPVVVAHNITAPVSGSSYKAGSTVSFTGTFWDVPGNRHTAKWLIDGNTSVKGAVTEPSGLKNGKVTGSYRFTTPGVYKLQMNVTDQNGVTTYANTAGDLEAIVVIYDPMGGYTYGGGWFPSPAGTLASDPAAKGKVSYGFAVNYFKTATYPKGETQFEFKVGELEYNALNFDYLAIAGAKAQFKGSGKIIGGQSGIDFVMTVIDGALDGTGTDKVRIKIYNKNTGHVYYDNEPGRSEADDPFTPAGLNSTVVISSAAVTTRTAPADRVSEAPKGLEVGVLPNPTQHGFNVRVRSANKTDRLQLQVFDQRGRLLETRTLSGELTPGVGSNYRPGTYYIRVFQGKEHKEVKVIKL